MNKKLKEELKTILTKKFTGERVSEGLKQEMQEFLTNYFKENKILNTPVPKVVLNGNYLDISWESQ